MTLSFSTVRVSNRSSSRCLEDFVDEDDRISNQQSARKLSGLILHENSSKERFEEDKTLRRHSESHLKKWESFRNNVKKTLNLGTSRRIFNGKGLDYSLPDRIANTIRDRITETGMEKYADIVKKFENKYQILDFFLGEGTTGLVKQCLSKENYKIYAVKIIRTNDIEVLKTIKNEFLLQKILSHPNIVKVHEMFYNPMTSNIKLVMEMIKGCELFELIEKNGPIIGIYVF